MSRDLLLFLLLLLFNFVRLEIEMKNLFHQKGGLIILEFFFSFLIIQEGNIELIFFLDEINRSILFISKCIKLLLSDR